MKRDRLLVMRTATAPQVNAKRGEMTGAELQELEEPGFSRWVEPGFQRTGPDVCSTVHDAYGQRPGVPGDGNEWFRRSAPALPEVIGGLRHEIVAFARWLGADDDLCQNLALAVGEGLNNTAIHAYPDGKTGLVHVEAWHDQHGQLLVRIKDEGIGMVPRPDSPGLGLGLPLMAQMADEVQVADRDDVPGTMVLLRLTLRASPAVSDCEAPEHNIQVRATPARLASVVERLSASDRSRLGVGRTPRGR
jgi:anti-sigma regulatory factor (Ser/Thr protein kinase)